MKLMEFWDRCLVPVFLEDGTHIDSDVLLSNQNREIHTFSICDGHIIVVLEDETDDQNT